MIHIVHIYTPGKSQCSYKKWSGRSWCIFLYIFLSLSLHIIHLHIEANCDNGARGVIVQERWVFKRSAAGSVSVFSASLSRSAYNANTYSGEWERFFKRIAGGSPCFCTCFSLSAHHTHTYTRESGWFFTSSCCRRVRRGGHVSLCTCLSLSIQCTSGYFECMQSSFEWI